MKIKRFEGKETAEILQLIKAELGPDAVILSTREVAKKTRLKSGGFKVVPMIEIMAANEAPAVPQPAMPVRKTVARKSQVPEGTYPFEAALEEAVQGDIYKELQSIQETLHSLKETERRVVSTPIAAREKVPQENFHETWLEMKMMLKALTEMKRANPIFREDHTLSYLLEQLVRSGMDAETATHLVKAVEEQLPQSALSKPDRVQDSLHHVVETLVQVTGPFSLNEAPKATAPKVVALIGPTGVGKTTTVAKLGVYHQQKNQKVTLVSLDDSERGEGDALIQHADRHGLPALKVASWARFGQWVAGRKKDELILVDTAGRSHLKADDVAVLKGLTSVGMPLETHLLLSANTKGSDLSEMIDRFSVIPIDSLLFTKIDETQSYGPLFSAMGRKRKPVSYLTTGRRIPDDIELATPKRFTDLVLTHAVAEKV